MSLFLRTEEKRAAPAPESPFQRPDIIKESNVGALTLRKYAFEPEFPSGIQIWTIWRQITLIGPRLLN